MRGRAVRLAVAVVLPMMAAVVVAVGPIAGAWAAEKRVALVIRNAAYQDGPQLAAAAANAATMTVALRTAGFDVTVASDVDHRTLASAMAEFQRRLATADLGLLYYSGLMMSIGGQSFLLPVDARLRYEFDVVFETVELEQILQQIRDASHKAVVVIDTMMPNPAVARLAAGMGDAASTVKPAPANPPDKPNLLTAYSHQPGDAPPPVAGRTAGPYAIALAKEIAKPGAELRAALTAAADAVAAQTGGAQRPWFADRLPGALVLVSAPAAAVAPPPAVTPPVAAATPPVASTAPVPVAPVPPPAIVIPPPPVPKPAVIAAAPPSAPAPTSTEEPVRTAALAAPRVPDAVSGRFPVGRVYTTVGPAVLLATPAAGAAPVRNLERGAPLTVLETAENPSWVRVRDIFYNEGYVAARSLTPDGELPPLIARVEPAPARTEPPRAEAPKPEPAKPEPDRQVAMLPGVPTDPREEAETTAASAAWPPHVRQAVTAAEDAARRGGTGGSGAARRALAAA
ncbi:caspase family protein, partial [Azospirillum oleiclasticum]